MWSLTWREFSALKRVWRDSRDHVTAMYAELQATLHNASERFHNKDFHPEPWTRHDFMPGRKPVGKQPEAEGIERLKQLAGGDDWRANRMIIGMMLHAASEHNKHHGVN